MEATGGAQYWARQFTALGHEVRLMSPALVMLYRKGNKTDRNDANAILEAVTRPSMRSAMVKSVAQQDLLALHRVRAQSVKSRTTLCNPAARSVTRALATVAKCMIPRKGR